MPDTTQNEDPTSRRQWADGVETTGTYTRMMAKEEQARLRRSQELSANDVQHGGEHYQRSGTIQHWDFVHHHRLDYFQGNATKYLTRWRQKNGIEDLKKAKHYCEKAVELGLFSDVCSNNAKDDALNFGVGYKLTALEVMGLAAIMDRSWDVAITVIDDLMNGNDFESTSGYPKSEQLPR